MSTTYKSLALPVAAEYRLRIQERRHDPAAGGPGIVALERRKFGPFWTELDARAKEGFTKLSPREQQAWVEEMERELTEEWFAEEIADLRR